MCQVSTAIQWSHCAQQSPLADFSCIIGAAPRAAEHKLVGPSSSMSAKYRTHATRTQQATQSRTSENFERVCHPLVDGLVRLRTCCKDSSVVLGWRLSSAAQLGGRSSCVALRAVSVVIAHIMQRVREMHAPTQQHS
jgi:hypothetical protein